MNKIYKLPLNQNQIVFAALYALLSNAGEAPPLVLLEEEEEALVDATHFHYAHPNAVRVLVNRYGYLEYAEGFKRRVRITEAGQRYVLENEAVALEWDKFKHALDIRLGLAVPEEDSDDPWADEAESPLADFRAGQVITWRNQLTRVGYILEKSDRVLKVQTAHGQFHVTSADNPLGLHTLLTRYNTRGGKLQNVTTYFELSGDFTARLYYATDSGWHLTNTGFTQSGSPLITASYGGEFGILKLKNKLDALLLSLAEKEGA